MVVRITTVFLAPEMAGSVSPSLATSLSLPWLSTRPWRLCVLLVLAALLLAHAGLVRGLSRRGRALDPFEAESTQGDLFSLPVEEAPVKRGADQRPPPPSAADASYAESMLAVTDMGVDAMPSPASRLSESAATLQQDAAAFTVERLTAQAPWSNRIQPGFAYRSTPLSYLQYSSGINITAAPGYLLMWEGAFRATYQGRDYIENDVPKHAHSRTRNP